MHWFESGNAEPNEVEILFFALLLVATTTTAKELDSWARKVLLEKPEAEDRRAAWKPRERADGWTLHNRVSTLFQPMERAYRGTS